MSDFFTDLKGVVSSNDVENVTAKHSTNKKAGSDLEMTDFLQLMVATFQNQSIDDVASTSDMMNQMVQMSVINALTNLSSMVSETTALSYASSLVGKEVTIGQTLGYETTTITGKVTGTGTLNGQPVIFIGDKSYWLSDVMAVGRIPDNVTVPGTERDALAEALGISKTEAAKVLSAWDKYWNRKDLTKDEQALLKKYDLTEIGELYDSYTAGGWLSQTQLNRLDQAAKWGLIPVAGRPVEQKDEWDELSWLTSRGLSVDEAKEINEIFYRFRDLGAGALSDEERQKLAALGLIDVEFPSQADTVSDTQTGEDTSAAVEGAESAADAGDGADTDSGDAVSEITGAAEDADTGLEGAEAVEDGAEQTGEVGETPDQTDEAQETPDQTDAVQETEDHADAVQETEDQSEAVGEAANQTEAVGDAAEENGALTNEALEDAAEEILEN